MNLAVYWLCVAVLLSFNVLVQSEITNLYPTDSQDWSLFPYGAGAGDVVKQDADDRSWYFAGIFNYFNFFGTSYATLQINTNGYLVIGAGKHYNHSMISDQFPSAHRIRVIAPFNSDIDFTNYTPGFISYREDRSSEILQRATDAVMSISQYAQDFPNFRPTWTFIVTWHDAVFRDAQATDPRVTNTFQLVLACRYPYQTFAIFNYGHQMDWAGAGGDSSTGLGGFAASVGVDAGDGVRGFTLPGSQTDAIREIVRNQRLVFRVDSSTFDFPMCVPGSMSASGDTLSGPCTECLVGFYQPHVGSVNCTACPSGETTLNTGSYSSEDCISTTPTCSVTPRPIQHYPDLYRGSIIFVDFPFQCSGSVSGVEFYAEGAGTFYFSAWRPSASGDSWTLLGYNAIVSEGEGDQIFPIPSDEQMVVEATDVFGFFYERGVRYRIISSENIHKRARDDTSSRFVHTKETLEDLSIGVSMSNLAGGGSTERIVPINAIIS